VRYETEISGSTVVGADAQRVVRAGEAIDEALFRIRAQ
jgi:hypothetical protein